MLAIEATHNKKHKPNPQKDKLTLLKSLNNLNKQIILKILIKGAIHNLVHCGSIGNSSCANYGNKSFLLSIITRMRDTQLKKFFRKGSMLQNIVRMHHNVLQPTAVAETLVIWKYTSWASRTRCKRQPTIAMAV